MNSILLCFLVCLILFPIIYRIYKIMEKLDDEKHEERTDYYNKIIDKEK